MIIFTNMLLCFTSIILQHTTDDALKCLVWFEEVYLIYLVIFGRVSSMLLILYDVRLIFMKIALILLLCVFMKCSYF